MNFPPFSAFSASISTVEKRVHSSRHRDARSLRTLGVVLLSVLSLFLTACGQMSAEHSAPVIGFIGLGTIENSSRANSEKKTVAGLRDQGYEVTYIPSKKRNAQEQIVSVKNVVAQGVDALVVSPQLSNLWTDTLAPATAAKVPIIFLNREPSGFPQHLYSTALGPSYSDAGTTLAKWAQSHGYEGTTESTMLLSPPLDGTESSDFGFGWTGVFDLTFTDYDPVITTWDKDSDRRILEQAFETRGIPNLIVAQNGYLATLALDLLDERGLSVPVVAVTDNTAMTDTDKARLATCLTWDSDFSRPLGSALRTLLDGGTVAKDLTVPLEPFAPETETP